MLCRSYRAGALCALIVATCSGCFALLLLAGAASGSGSPGGNVLTLALGVLLLLVSVIAFIFGVVIRKS
jgi:hypothetical protein